VEEGGILGGVPLRTPISGNGLMPRAYEVVNDASPTGIFPNLEVMLDDRKHIGARYIVDSSMQATVTSDSRSVAT
jgi:hypothetical protein